MPQNEHIELHRFVALYYIFVFNDRVLGFFLSKNLKTNFTVQKQDQKISLKSHFFKSKGDFLSKKAIFP